MDGKLSSTSLTQNSAQEVDKRTVKELAAALCKGVDDSAIDTVARLNTMSREMAQNVLNWVDGLLPDTRNILLNAVIRRLQAEVGK